MAKKTPSSEEEQVLNETGLDSEMDAPAELVEETVTTNVKFDRIIKPDESGSKRRLTGMFKDWYLDYASYVILERAVPHLEDGLKPVQRRILHSMRQLDDGRYNKVANIIGDTMKYHPHGDASIGDALVQLGQKELLVDTQGNWGNLFTEDEAAAPRYIEARLSKFALDVVYNPKTTEWMSSYDGRNLEPVTLPIKFPLLLAQGVEGIAVGLTSKVLPHNFNELITASIAYLKGEKFDLYPDFPTGGMVDVSKYNDGIRGGAVKVRASISKLDKRTLVINDLPFGRTSNSIIESIIKANDKGKIKVKKIDNNTAAKVEIVLHLHNDVSPDKTIDALYAFTDCELSISPNACVIFEDKPHFIGVSEILRRNTDRTLTLLNQELLIRMEELHKDWYLTSLEKIFFEKEIYEELKKTASDFDAQLLNIQAAFHPYEKLLRRQVSLEDVERLCEKPVRKISRFDIKKADEHIAAVEEEMKQVQYNLDHLVEYAISYFENIQKKYGKGRDRMTQITSFENITAAQVAVANAKLYINAKEGFMGMDLKRDDEAEFVCECSDIDDIIVFLRTGDYKVIKVSDKTFVGKNIVHAGVFKRNDERTVYNVLYHDGKAGAYYMKRFSVTGVIRDKEYNLTKGTPGSEILWFSANPNGEAEILKVYFKPRARLRNLVTELDFKDLEIKGRQAQGNIFTRNMVHKVLLKEKGVSTLGGQKIWFDADIQRLNFDDRGTFLGEFFPNDRILALFKNGNYFTTNTDLSNRYEGEILSLTKYDKDIIYTALYFDAEQKYYYLKRFMLEPSAGIQSFIDEDNPNSYLIELSTEVYPQVEIIFGGKHAKREIEKIDAEEFIGIKSFRAKGKRLTTFEVSKVHFIEPLQKQEILPELNEEVSENEAEDLTEINIADKTIGGNEAVQMDLGF